MRSRTRAIPLLALGLGLTAPSGHVNAAPSTPPPPKTRSTTPPPPGSAGSPFLPTSRGRSAPSGGTTATPPAPTGPVALPDDGSPTSPSARPSEPEQPPQDLSNTWGFSRSRTGVQPRYVRTRDPTFAAPNPVGFYSGVSVKGNHVPPFPAKDKGTKPALMTWTGFERAPEGSRVFFQLSAAAGFEVDRKGQTIRIRMRNTKVNVRNNLRYLDLRYFKTPVRTVKVRRKGKDTIATIVLKRDANPQVSLMDGKAGYKLLVVQFSDISPTANSFEPPPPPP
ncbi:MAG: hypothetical protein AAGF11_30065 [Myxococcota bacterium]